MFISVSLLLLHLTTSSLGHPLRSSFFRLFETQLRFLRFLFLLRSSSVRPFPYTVPSLAVMPRSRFSSLVLRLKSIFDSIFPLAERAVSSLFEETSSSVRELSIHISDVSPVKYSIPSRLDIFIPLTDTDLTEFISSAERSRSLSLSMLSEIYLRNAGSGKFVSFTATPFFTAADFMAADAVIADMSAVHMKMAHIKAAVPTAPNNLFPAFIKIPPLCTENSAAKSTNIRIYFTISQGNCQYFFTMSNICF